MLLCTSLPRMVTVAITCGCACTVKQYNHHDLKGSVILLSNILLTGGIIIMCNCLHDNILKMTK